MRRIVTWMAAGAALLPGSVIATPAAAQCMACTSSGACGPSSVRGNCIAECYRQVCACSDGPCRPEITVARVGAEFAGQLAGDNGEEQPQGGAVALLVRDCDGTVEFLVYSADGTRLIDARLLSAESGRTATAATGQRGDQQRLI
jgi:hypothetical protein